MYKLFIVIAFLLLQGCAYNSPPPLGYAECPVCKANGDLACLHVKAVESSVHITEADKIVYFCSEECKEEFEQSAQQDNYRGSYGTEY